MSIGSFLGAAGVGSTIGQAIVHLELDSAKYTAEMEAAKGKTVASTQAMGSSTSRFSTLAQTAFLAAGAAAVAGLAMSVKAAIEAQEAQENLHNTIKNAPQLAADAEQALLDQAEATRSLTGADDEAVIAGESLLGQMGLTKDAIIDLTPLVVDLAEKNNIDLQAAFKAVGKAAQGNTGSLARYIGTIDKGATPAETLSNVLDKLGVNAGFAAKQARNEPWRLLKSDMEELSEDIGTALLPAIENLATALHNLTPLLESVAKGIQFLPLFQMTEDITSSADGVHKFANALVDTIPVLGHFVDFANPVDELGGRFERLTEDIPNFASSFEDANDALDRGRSILGPIVNRFLPGLNKGLDHVGGTAKKVADDFQYTETKLDDLAESTKVSDRAFEQYFRHLDRNSRDLKQTARDLRDEKWINQEFIDFLSAKGPEWLVEFGNLNEGEQRRWQNSWEKSNERTKKANENLGAIKSSLDKLNGDTTRHTVEVRYKYVGFDPTKPGMKPSSAGGQV